MSKFSHGKRGKVNIFSIIYKFPTLICIHSIIGLLIYFQSYSYTPLIYNHVFPQKYIYRIFAYIGYLTHMLEKYFAMTQFLLVKPVLRLCLIFPNPLSCR